MSREIVIILAIIGAIAAIVIIGCGIMIGISMIIDGIEELKYQKRIKNRFKKPPLAKCYCVNCKYWHAEVNRCYKYEGLYPWDSYFCKDAEPRERGIDK